MEMAKATSSSIVGFLKMLCLIGIMTITFYLVTDRFSIWKVLGALVFILFAWIFFVAGVSSLFIQYFTAKEKAACAREQLLLNMKGAANESPRQTD